MNLDKIKVKDCWLFTLIHACNTTALPSHSELGWIIVVLLPDQHSHAIKNQQTRDRDDLPVWLQGYCIGNSLIFFSLSLSVSLVFIPVVISSSSAVILQWAFSSGVCVSVLCYFSGDVFWNCLNVTHDVHDSVCLSHCEVFVFVLSLLMQSS